MGVCVYAWTDVWSGEALQEHLGAYVAAAVPISGRTIVKIDEYVC